MKKLIQNIKNKIFKKKNINELDPLKEEEKNEELIEKIVHDHKGIYNWTDEDLKLLTKLIHPNISYQQEDEELPPFCEAKLSCFFEFKTDKKNNFVVGEIKEINKKKIPKIELESVLVSIQEIEGPTDEIFKRFKQKNSKKVLNLLGKNKDNYKTILDRFVVSRPPNTKVKLKLRKNKKIKEVILKLGSFDDKIIAQRSDLIKKHNYTKNQADVWIKEWKREFFYSAFLSDSRATEILNDKKIEYKPKTLIDRFLELESEYKVSDWDNHLLDRLEKIIKKSLEKKFISSKSSLRIFKRSYIDFFYNWPKSRKQKDLTSVKIMSYANHGSHIAGKIPKEGDVIISMEWNQPHHKYKKKIKNQTDLSIFLGNVKPGSSIDIKFKEKNGSIFKTIIWTKNFEEYCETLIKEYGRYYVNYSKAELALIEYKKSFIVGQPDFTLDTLKKFDSLEIEDTAKHKYVTVDDEENYTDEEKIYLTTTVKKEKVAGKESFALTLDGFPDDERLETLADGKKIFLKIYIFDVTDLDSDKYYEISDTTGLTDQYFSNHCHIIKTNEITWSDGNMNLIQSKELEPYGDHPTKLAFPYSVMLLPKVGKRRLSFRTFLCTDKQEFDDAEGRPKDGESINYRPESFKMDDYAECGFDDYGDYPEILSYTSSEIDVEYKQPGYLDINRRKYNSLAIALSLALNQLDGKSFKENFKKIKDKIEYDGDHSAEGNIYKSLSLKSNYEHALKEKIDLRSILKELKKNSRIHERYEMIDLLLNLAITDETYSAKENEFIDKVAKTLDLHNEKFQEIKKRKTASVKFVDFGDQADESIFGITKDMNKKEKLRVLRKEYSRWNALTNNSDKAIRERARAMRDMAANIRRKYT